MLMDIQEKRMKVYKKYLNEKKMTVTSKLGSYEQWETKNTGNTICRCKKCGKKVSHKNPREAMNMIEKHLKGCK